MRHTPDLGMMRKTVESADGKGGSMGDSVGRREPGHSSHHKGLRIGIGVTLGFGFAALASLPVEVAEIGEACDTNLDHQGCSRFRTRCP